MAIVNLDFYSYELAMNTQAAVLLPEKRGVPCRSREGEPYPVLYLLHGHGQDFTSWTRFTRLESYLQNSDVIVVMPNGSRGCYVDGTATHRYGTYLTDELPVALSNWFHLSSARENTFIAGMSMGGYGALRAALAHPDRYAAAVGLSTAGRLDKMELKADSAEKGLAIPRLGEVPRNFFQVFGPDADYETSEYSLKALARRLNDSGAPAPRLLQLCGDDDPLLEQNQELAEFIRTDCPRLDHTFRVSPGMHNFDFWDAKIPEIFRFFGFSL